MRNLEEETPGLAPQQTPEPSNLSLKDQVFSKNWKVRSTAFKEINNLMVNYNPAHRENATKEDLMYGDLESPFDSYGILIDQMIKDSNLTAQFDGYTCLLTYVRHCPGDIKSVVQSCTS